MNKMAMVRKEKVQDIWATNKASRCASHPLRSTRCSKSLLSKGTNAEQCGSEINVKHSGDREQTVVQYLLIELLYRKRSYPEHEVLIWWCLQIWKRFRLLDMIWGITHIFLWTTVWVRKRRPLLLLSANKTKSVFFLATHAVFNPSIFYQYISHLLLFPLPFQL